jgi:hypothetical protein
VHRLGLGAHVIRAELTGSDSQGWRWSVFDTVEVLFRSKPLERADLSSALFTLQRDRDRREPAFDHASDEEAFFVLKAFFSGGLNEVLRPTAEAQTWAKFHVTPIIPSEVHHFMFLLDGPEPRFLWGRETLLGASGECGDFEAQLRSCRERLD